MDTVLSFIWNVGKWSAFVFFGVLFLPITIIALIAERLNLVEEREDEVVLAICFVGTPLLFAWIYVLSVMLARIIG